MKPTGRQLRYLRHLAQATGTTFTPPRTAAEASREINRLKARPVETTAIVSVERREIQAAISNGVGDAPRHRRGETRGYGSSARWAHRPDSREQAR